MQLLTYINDHLLGIINIVLVLFAALGGLFTFRKARKESIIKIQDETIEALQDQINALKQRQTDIEDKNAEIEQKSMHLEHIIETIKDALRQRGILVTIDGDLVTINDASGSHSLRRNPDNPLSLRRQQSKQSNQSSRK